MPDRLSLLAALFLATACGFLGCAVPGGPRSELPKASAEATQIAEGWFQNNRGFDALEAYELQGSDGVPVRFAVARKWTGESVKLLSYVLEPRTQRGLAFLLLREPGRKPEGYRRNGRAVSRFGAPTRPAAADNFALGAEVVQLALPEDYVHSMGTDANVDGERCTVIKSYLLRPTRYYTHLVRYISQETGVALRTVYYKGESQLRRVEVPADAVRDVAGRMLAERRIITTADGGGGEIVLHNVLTDIELPDRLFSPQRLHTQRFPNF